MRPPHDRLRIDRRVERPDPRQPLERVTAALREPEPAARHDAFDRLGDQDLTGSGHPNDPSRHVDRHTAVLRAEAITLPGVDPDTSVESEAGQGPRELEPASHRVRRCAEGREEADSGACDLTSLEALGQLT